MKKITLSFDVLAAIISVTILQARASTAVTPATQCAQPTLTPPSGSGAAGAPITVTIATTTTGAYLRWTDDDSTPTSGYGKLIKAQSGPAPTVFGRTLKAIAYKAGLSDSSIAVGKYQASSH
jgi:hypothetical protein